MPAAPTEPRPAYTTALTAVAAFLDQHPNLPEPKDIGVRFYDWDNRHHVHIDLPQGVYPLDSEHAVTAWADALGGTVPRPGEHTDTDGKPWTHVGTEGTWRDLSIRVVICHRYPEPASATAGAQS